MRIPALAVALVRAPLRAHALVLGMAAIALAGCPEQAGQSCPPSTAAVGRYSLVLSLQHGPGECLVTVAPDGGAMDASLAQDNIPARPATLCEGTAADGGVLLYLAVPANGARPGPLLEDGGFSFAGHSAPTRGTACVCDVAIDETITGRFTGLPDSGFALLPDGGLPFIGGLSGVVVDHLTTPAGPCACNLPCDVTYGLAGTRF